MPLSVAALLSCSHVGPYVWVDDYAPPAGNPGDYRVAVGDVLSVVVYQQDKASAREKVRQDGKVSLPLIGDVEAAGFPPNELAHRVQERLTEFINFPRVTVSVAETHPLVVPVLGEVAKPGQYTLEKGAGVLDALAAGGGFTDFAHRDRIFVLRRDPKLVRIRFTFEALSRGQGRAAALQLQDRDVVVVE
jgi:polysaccharide export outer membrane protein